MTAFGRKAAIVVGAERMAVYCATGPKSGLSAPSNKADSDAGVLMRAKDLLWIGTIRSTSA
jgi:hypothetical protein